MTNIHQTSTLSFEAGKKGHPGSTKTGEIQAHAVTATTPVQLRILLSLNSIINYSDNIEFIDSVNNGIEQIKHFKAGRIK